jgi:O-antigen ligase
MAGPRLNNGRHSLYMLFILAVFFLLLVLIALIIPSLSAVKTVALILGVVLFIASFMSTEAALYILIFSMLLSPEFIIGSTGGSSLGRGVTIRADDFLILIIGLSWLARMSINKELGMFLRTPLNKPIAFYILLCLVSTLFGSLFGRVDFKTGFFFVLKYFEYVIVFFMVVNHLKTEKQVIRFVWAILITCTIVSIIGVSQIPMGGRVSAPFEGASGEPNTLGGYLIFIISITTGLLLTSRKLRDKIIFAGLVLLFFIPLLYTQSRSSYIALIPAMISFLFLSEKKIIIFSSIFFVALIFMFFTPDVAKKRIDYTFTQGQNRSDVVEIGGIRLDTSTSDRIKSWYAASKDWMKEPLLGYGVTGYKFIDAQYLRVLVETGIIGLLLFLILMGAIYKMAYKNFLSSKTSFNRGLTMGFLAGFTGLLFHALGANTFIIVRIMEPFWFVTGMVILSNQIEDNEQTGKPEKGEEINKPAYRDRITFLSQ